MVRPPDRRPGDQLSVAGRLIVAGVGSHQRLISPRASAADLWAAIDSLAVPGPGTERLADIHAVHLSPAAQRRFAAYVRQARAYYGAIRDLDPVAKPLLGYYFALNLAKAFLTAVDPPTTEGRNLGHGAGDATKVATRYRITQETIKIHNNGVVRDLAERTGMTHCWPGGDLIKVAKLFPYLVEAVDLYADASGRAPKLLPVARTQVVATSRARGAAWLTVDVARAALKERGIPATKLTQQARAFGAEYRLVHDAADRDTNTYEALNPRSFTTRKAALPLVRELFDRSLILRNRTSSGGKDYVVLSARPSLLSQEAVTLVLLLHLSNIVRYRPHHAEALNGTTHSWLFSSWVDRACENFLLAMSSRLSLEEHVIG